MKSVTITLLMVASLLLSGCVEDSPGTDDEAAANDLLAPPLADALWPDPQQYPHPAYHWPTVTHIPDNAPDWWQPIPATEVPLDPVGFEPVGGGGPGWGGDGFGVFGGLAVFPAVGETAPLYDIRDPENAVLLTELPVGMTTRQALFMPHTDGRLFALFATDAGLIPVWDVTDPLNAREVTIVDVDNNGHTIAIVSGTPILYHANAAGSLPFFPFNPVGSTGGQTEIYDFSDPAQPVLLQAWQNGYGCHAISFHINEERSRAYCAGVDATQIWDITAPLQPTVVATIPMPHGEEGGPGVPPPASISHWAVVNYDATVLAIADEAGGGAAPMCDAHVPMEGGDLSGPLGNVWFYDISNEQSPVLLSWISPSAHIVYQPEPGACTAHVGRMVPHEERDLLVMAFYRAGLVLIDFTNAGSPVIAAQHADDNPMDAWYYQGYIFAGDGATGLGVYRLVDS